MKKKQMGVWLDRKEAFIIDVDHTDFVQTVNSEVEDFHVKGGARSKQPWGPMDKTDERRYLERRKHQTQHYYQTILDVLKDADEVYIAGPAETKKGLEKTLLSHSAFQGSILAVEPADKMTRNQLIAKVKNFFSVQTG